MKKICIVGYGRFGKVLHRLIGDDFLITIFSRSTVHDTSLFSPTTRTTNSLDEAYKNDTIFFAVPIDAFESVIASHAPYFKANHLLIDVLSVKMHPEKTFRKYLKKSRTQFLLTHPMFGPDSSANGFEGLPLIISGGTAHARSYAFWKRYFIDKKLSVIELSAKEHDRLAADSQGLTHFVGRMLNVFGIKPTLIDSLGSKKLLEVHHQTCNDTWQLFTNLQNFNPYTNQMRLRVGKAYEQVFNELLPKRVHPNYITYGIQGGKGSFNEEALLYQSKRSDDDQIKIIYLHTSERVLAALDSGKIDVGQFAVHNSTGGMVQESLMAMTSHTFEIVKQFAIQISHALMIRSDSHLGEVDTIMTHPQVLAQCKKTLSKKYPLLHQTSGKGLFVDHALVAQKLGAKQLPKNVAVMGSRILASLYDLSIAEDNLQDLKENYTTFLQVRRPSGL